MFDLHLTDEQKAIRESVRKFVAKEIAPIAVERDRKEDFELRFPWEALAKANELGLRTLLLSQENGGSGVDALTYCIVIEELAVGDVGVAATIGQTAALAHTWFDVLMTPEQRSRFLPQFLADPRFHLATAGHEPDTDLGWCYHQPTVAGSGYQTTAVRARNGDWILNGVKNFITSAPISRLLAVHARTGPKTSGASAVTSFLVPRDTPGLTIREHDKVGRRLGSNGELVFEDCRIPAENVLGIEGRSTFLESTFSGRGLPCFQAMNLGIGRAAYEAALEYAKLRVQGGRRIIEHQAVALSLANMTVALEAARSLLWRTAWASDHPDAHADGSLPDLPLQTISKIFVSETVQRVALDAAQIFGGIGVMRELPMQKYVRDALIFLHSEMSNDVARLRVAERLARYERPRTIL